MKYNYAAGEKLSRLGFGTMRLPCNEDKTIDQDRVQEMVDYAMANGINYFDTAWPYHGGYSEISIGKALAKYPRESYKLATKFPGHQIADNYDAAAIFNKQLEKCGVEYFDFYLLHNVYEKSIGVFKDPKWGIVDYLVEQKKLGRIKHLGFSSHGRIDNLREALDLWGDEIEFVQIQLNYLDWTLQDAKAKYDLITSRGIPVWVMEPVRGGRLAKLSPSVEQKLHSLRPGASCAAWAFRWIEQLGNVKMILSGMSSLEQMRDNINTFSSNYPLTAEENDLLLAIAEGMKNSLPCTGCRYCCDGCPMGLDIPKLISWFNDIRFGFEGALTAAMQLEALPDAEKPSACVGCGACAATCPQKIDVPQAMTDLCAAIEKLPKWTEISKQRAEEAKKFQ